jgi:hypothetical protein
MPSSCLASIDRARAERYLQRNDAHRLLPLGRGMIPGEDRNRRDPDDADQSSEQDAKNRFLCHAFALLRAGSIPM